MAKADLQAPGTNRLKPYKARLNRWGFTKYITTRLEREALQHVAAKGLHRQGAAKPETVRLSNGTTISLSSLVTHLGRKRTASSNYPASVLRNMRSPDDLWISEQMLGNACEYIRRQYSTKNTADYMTKASLPNHYGDYYKGLVAVRRLLQASMVEDALLVLRRAPEQIRFLLSDADSVNNAFGCICITVLCIKYDESKASHMNATLRALMRYAASVVHETRGPEPLRRILTSLTKLDDAVFREAIIRTWRCQLQTWTSMGKPYWQVGTLGEWMVLGETAGCHLLPPNFTEALADTISVSEEKYGRASQPVLTLLWLQGEHERLLAEQGNLPTDRAREIFQDMLVRGPHNLDTLIKYSALHFLAHDSRRRGDRVGAEKWMRDAIASLYDLEGRPCYGVSLSLELTLDLERWLTEWGEHDKAREIRQQTLQLRLAHEKMLPKATTTTQEGETVNSMHYQTAS